MRATTGLLVALLALAACEKEPFRKPMKLGGKVVSGETLSAGHEGYMLYCYACHGEKGDGRGPSAAGLRPPPRDFRLGKFKFAAVASGQLPNDEDFLRIVQNGLHGTAMLAWDVPEVTLKNIIQYIKIFSPRWKDEEPGEALRPSPDPFGAARKAEAVAQGKKIYHGLAQCWVCHPAYTTRQDMYDAAKELRHVEQTEFRDDLYNPALKDSDYEIPLQPGKKLNILPPDFTVTELRSVRAGHELEDYYRVIGSGIGGTAMPQWKGTGAITEEQLWAMAYYVKSLADLRDTSGARELKAQLLSQPDWKPPTPAPAPPAPQAPEKK